MALFSTLLDGSDRRKDINEHIIIHSIRVVSDIAGV